MANLKIIFQPADASKPISVVNPSPTYSGTMAELAAMTVPKGIKYKIIDADDSTIKAELADRSFRNAWTADFSTSDGVGGADD